MTAHQAPALLGQALMALDEARRAVREGGPDVLYRAGVVLWAASRRFQDVRPALTAHYRAARTLKVAARAVQILSDVRRLEVLADEAWGERHPLTVQVYSQGSWARRVSSTSIRCAQDDLRVWARERWGREPVVAPELQ